MGMATVLALLITFTPGPRDHSHAVAVAPHGMLLAWSAVDPVTAHSVIHVALLDHDAQFLSPIRTLAPIYLDAHSTTPVIATDGHRFFVAWVERDRARWDPWRVSGALVDSNGEQLGPTLNLGAAGDAPPALAWNGVDFRYHGATSYAISADGVAQKIPSPPVPRRVQFATAEANGWVDWSNTAAGVRCGFSWCAPTTPSFTVTWAVISYDWIRTGRFDEQGYSGGRPAVIANGDDITVIWTDLRGLVALPVVDGRAQKVFRLATRAKNPAAAESLVVFESGGDIYGSFIDGTSFGAPFPITTSKQWEEKPRVDLVGPNRYFVSWLVERDPGGTRINGTFVGK